MTEHTLPPDLYREGAKLVAVPMDPQPVGVLQQVPTKYGGVECRDVYTEESITGGSQCWGDCPTCPYAPGDVLVVEDWETREPVTCKVITIARLRVTAIEPVEIEKVTEEQAIQTRILDWWNSLPFEQQAEIYSGGRGPSAALKDYWRTHHPDAKWAWLVSVEELEDHKT